MRQPPPTARTPILRSSAGAGARRAVRLAALAGTLLLGACDLLDRNTSEDHLRRAQELRFAGDLNGSIIELKNALQKDPESAEARFLLGQIYLHVGDGAGAEKELRRAADLGLPHKQAQRSLGEALLLQGKYDEVLRHVRILPSLTPEGRAAVTVLHGRALFGLDRLDEARARFDEAIALNSTSVDAILGLARSEMRDDRFEEAQAHIQRALQIAGDTADVLTARGDLAFERGDYGQAVEAYETVVARWPKLTAPRLGLAWAQIGQSKYETALAGIDLVLDANPNHLLANYLRALAMFRMRNYENAKRFGRKVLSATSHRHAPTLFIVSAAHFAVGEYEQATELLERLVAAEPKNVEGRRLLAATLLKSDRPDRALATLEPLSDAPVQDAQLLAMMATALVETGNFDGGRSYYRRAVSARPEDPGIRNVLAQIGNALGEKAPDTFAFPAESEIDPAIDATDVALILDFLNERDFAEAAETARRLVRLHGNLSTPHALLGVALAAGDRTEEAKAALAKAMEIKPGHPHAAHYLALLALREGDTEGARRYYERVLEHRPGHLRTLMRLVELEAREANPDRVLFWLEEAVRSHPAAVRPRILLGRVYLLGGKPFKALATIQAALRRYPHDPDLVEIVGRAQRDAGQPEEAAATLEGLVEVQAANADAHLLLAEVYEELGRLDEARAAAERVLDLEPGRGAARFLLARALVGSGESEPAKALLEELAEEFPDSAAVHALRGRVALVENRSEEAIEQFEQAVARHDSNRNVVQLAVAQARAGDLARSEATLREWLQTFPEDDTTRLALADLLMQTGRSAEAAEEFRAIVARSPDNVRAHNNLAWMLMELGEHEDALAYARRARDLAPASPTVLDTFGMILLAAGDARGAVDALDRAARQSPRNPAYRLHLAQAMAEAGREAEARSILRDLLAVETAFAGRDAAAALLARLGG